MSMILKEMVIFMSNEFSSKPLNSYFLLSTKTELRFCVRCNLPFMTNVPLKNTCSQECHREVERKLGHLKCKEYGKNYRNCHRKKYNIARLKKSKKTWQKIMDITGDKCIACGKQKPIPQYLSGQKRRISFHEIHGKKHKDNPWYILKHLEDFVPLCQSCHTSLHKVAKSKKLIELLSMVKPNETL